MNDHFYQYHDGHDHSVKGGDYGHSHGHADGLQVIGKMCHQISGFMTVEIAGGKGFQMSEHIVPKFVLDSPGSADDTVPPAKTPSHDQKAGQEKLQQKRYHPVGSQRACGQSVNAVAGVLGDVEIGQIHQHQDGDAQ